MHPFQDNFLIYLSGSSKKKKKVFKEAIFREGWPESGSLVTRVTVFLIVGALDCQDGSEAARREREKRDGERERERGGDLTDVKVSPMPSASRDLDMVGKERVWKRKEKKDVEGRTGCNSKSSPPESGFLFSEF